MLNPAKKENKMKNVILMASSCPGYRSTCLNLGWFPDETVKKIIEIGSASFCGEEPECGNLNDPQRIFENDCCFELHYEHEYKHETLFCSTKIKPFIVEHAPAYPMREPTWKDKENEFIVEIEPIRNGCHAKMAECPMYIYNGNCPSPFIRKCIGALLFPDKYGKPR